MEIFGNGKEAFFLSFKACLQGTQMANIDSYIWSPLLDRCIKGFPIRICVEQVVVQLRPHKQP